MSPVWWIILALALACAVLMWLEQRGLKTTLALTFKGDIKRETRWLAQYGQAVCTAAVAAVIWQMDPRRGRVVPLIAAAFTASVVATLIKRLCSRIRPGRPNAGKFLGPTWGHANFKESFPSSHSASAVALTVALCAFYPQATLTFWALALACAILRYLMDAHWPSDVVGGIALGYALANGVLWLFRLRYNPL